MVDELSSRRCRFLVGTPITLANDQAWIFPAPTAESEFNFEFAGADYLGLMRAIREAEDQSEQRMAELALAIFLIGLNYNLSSSDLTRLFTFQPRSQKLANSQHAFESLARDHLLALVNREKLFLPDSSPGPEKWTIADRLLAWLRNHGLLPKSVPTSRNSEALS